MQDEPMTVEEGGGPPLGTAWTLEVAGDAGWSADLEHAAPVPCIGERIDFIDRQGRQHHYRVAEVIHTIQASATERPPVAAEQAGPNAIVTDDASESDGEPPRSLRAGLPRVVVVPTD
ncbi:MAG: hypothetical protein M3406_02820 [Chloroflexota bacterium]|nr:hypothetical protein [Chloroflexota bacterium]